MTASNTLYWYAVDGAAFIPIPIHTRTSSASESSYSTNSTVSNLPGPGRTLDNLLSALGHKLDDFLACTTHKLGMGPHATTMRLEQRSGEIRYRRDDFGWFQEQEITEKERRKMARDCVRLLSYMESSQTPATQYQALQALIHLLTSSPTLRALFLSTDIFQYLQSLHYILLRTSNRHLIHFNRANRDSDPDYFVDRTMLLSACRQALVCVQDNRANQIGKDLTYILSSREAIPPDQAIEAAILMKELEGMCARVDEVAVGTSRSSETMTEEHYHLLTAYKNEFHSRLWDQLGHYSAVLEFILQFAIFQVSLDSEDEDEDDVVDGEIDARYSTPTNMIFPHPLASPTNSLDHATLSLGVHPHYTELRAYRRKRLGSESPNSLNLNLKLKPDICVESSGLTFIIRSCGRCLDCDMGRLCWVEGIQFERRGVVYKPFRQCPMVYYYYSSSLTSLIHESRYGDASSA